MSVGSVIANIVTKFTSIGTGTLLKSFTAVGRAATVMGATIAKAAIASTAAFAAGSVAAGVFAKKAADETLEHVQGIRSLAALTGENEAVIHFWKQYGGAVGLAGTDLDQVLSGFTSAMKDSSDASSDVGKMFAELGVSSTDAAGKVRSTSAVFSEFLKKLQGVDSQRRGSILTTVFGEDDALKVAELSKNVARDYGSLNSMLGQANAEGRLVTPEQIAATKRYQAAVLKLGSSFTTFKRKLFTAVEPIFTRYAGFFEGQLFKNGGAIIQQFFVKPIIAASNVFFRFLQLMDATQNFKVLRAAASQTFKVIGEGIEIAAHFARLLFLSFSGEGRTAAMGYANILDRISSAFARAFAWVDTDGPRAIVWAKDFAVALGGIVAGIAKIVVGLVRGINRALMDMGVDWRQVLTVDNLTAVFSSVVSYVGAFIRDIGRLFAYFTNDGSIFSGGFLETAFARMFLKGYIAAKEFVVSLGPMVTAAVAVIATKVTAAVRSFFQPLTSYLQTAWSEFQAQVDGTGPGIAGMSNTLAILMATLYETARYVTGLADAFHKVFALREDAPAGFKWVETLRDTIGALIENLATVLLAIKRILAPLDFVLEKLGLWNAATILIAATIGSKLLGLVGVSLFGAIARVIGLIVGPGSLGLAFAGLGPIISGLLVPLAALAAATTAFYALLKPIQEKLTNAFDFIPGVTSKRELDADNSARDLQDRSLAEFGRKSSQPTGAVTRAQQILASQDLSRRTGKLDEAGFNVDPTLVSRTYSLTGDAMGDLEAAVAANKPEALAPLTLVLPGGQKVEASATRSQVANLQSVFTGRLG